MLHCLAGSTDSITEHSIEFARRKRAGQAQFLVSRLVKFEALLPRAEAKLQECMAKLEHHTPEQREAVVQQLLRGLKSHAQGEPSASCTVHPV
jgi:ferritin-like protein